MCIIRKLLGRAERPPDRCLLQTFRPHVCHEMMRFVGWLQTRGKKKNAGRNQEVALQALIGIRFLSERFVRAKNSSALRSNKEDGRVEYRDAWRCRVQFPLSVRVTHRLLDQNVKKKRNEKKKTAAQSDAL